MKAKLEGMVLVGFALSLAVVLAIGIISFRSLARATDDAERATHAQEILTRLASLLSTATDIQTGQRGFAITVVQREFAARLRADAVLRARNEELQLATKQAVAADRLKSLFLATMSHELRTPQNSIIGFTCIILEGLAGPLNPEQSKHLGMVRGSARHLLALINNLLDMRLPGLNGLAVARAIRAEQLSAGVPIVAVTSYAMVGDREQALAAGCDGYVEKPIDPETFVAEISRYLHISEWGPP